MLPRLRPCSWRQVVAALLRCGVQVAHEDDFHIYVARMPYIKTLNKQGRVSVAVQLDLLRCFGLQRTEYVSFLPDETPAN